MTTSASNTLSEAELRSAALDGELRALAHTFVPLDTPDDARARLAALAPAIDDPRIIVSHRCAAWVWGWTPTACLSLCCSVSSRHRVPSTRRRAFGVREVAIEPDEIIMVEGVSVTTPVRTLIDLARHDDGADLPALLCSALREASASRQLSEPRVAAALRRRPSAAHARRARHRLRNASRDAGL